MENTQDAIQFAAIGIGATVIIDIWAFLLRRLWNIPSLDYALVGRWAGHMCRGKWFHTPIFTAAEIPNERPLGWALHYLIGIIFGVVFGAISNPVWLADPTLPAALLFGGLTVFFPFAIMQPAFGAGFAAANTPTPNIARIKSLTTHLIFGLGLWLTAVLLAGL